MINVGPGRKKSYVPSAGLRHGFKHGRTQKGETETLASQCVIKQSSNWRLCAWSTAMDIHYMFFSVFLMVNIC